MSVSCLDDQVASESKALQPQLQSLTEEALKSNPTLKARVDALSEKSYELQTKKGQVSQALNDRSVIDQTSYGGALQLTLTQPLAGRPNQFARANGGKSPPPMCGQAWKSDEWLWTAPVHRAQPR